MSNPRYTAEMRERAVKMVMQVRRESGQEKGAVARVAQQLGIGREALRGWVAERTFGVLAAAGLARTWQLRHVPSADLIAMLDAGGYARYDLRTATRLLHLCEIIDDRYDGQVGLIGRRFAAYPELRAALDALPGWGPVTVRLFLRELRGVWPGAGLPLDERAATGGHTCRCRPEHSQATCCRSKAKACLASAGTAGAA